MKGILHIIRGRRFRLHRVLSRVGHPPEGEDRWAVNPDARRWVLCDGASEGWRPADWAETLATASAEQGLNEASLKTARRIFQGAFQRAYQEADTAGNPGVPIQVGKHDNSETPAPLPLWLTRNAEARGSASTALVIETDRRGRHLFAKAVGDTCLFLLDGFTLKESFPLSSADSFNSFPPLISSIPSATADTIQQVEKEFSFRTYRAPSVLLVTDGLAEYLLALEPGKKRRSVFSFLSSCKENEFSTWTEREIGSGAMKDDDLTMLWVREE